MTLKTKVLVSIVALAAVVGTFTMAGADQPQGPRSARDPGAVARDIKEGKGQKLNVRRQWSGVWAGCDFVYLQNDVSTQRMPDGEEVEVSDNSDPMPPRNPNCTAERNPTQDELVAMRSHVAALNAANQVKPGPTGPQGPPSLPSR